jgi:NAD(P)-dependent dehydrogenase (short-subunit alcohol dehydrogenase family)
VSGMNDRVALVTGASSGNGRATAEAFAAKGASVVVAARREEDLAPLVTAIEARGGKATAVKTDVSATHAIETFGRLDYAINKAGIVHGDY